MEVSLRDFRMPIRCLGGIPKCSVNSYVANFTCSATPFSYATWAWSTSPAFSRASPLSLYSFSRGSREGLIQSRWPLGFHDKCSPHSLMYLGHFKHSFRYLLLGYSVPFVTERKAVDQKEFCSQHPSLTYRKRTNTAASGSRTKKSANEILACLISLADFPSRQLPPRIRWENISNLSAATYTKTMMHRKQHGTIHKGDRSQTSATRLSQNEP